MKLLLAVSVLGISMQSIAAVPVEQALEQCRAEQNALRRLSCYDNIKSSTPAAAHDNSAVQIETQSKTAEVSTPTENKQEADFGLEHKNIETESAQSMSVVVTALSYSPRKELIIDFDNGQRWRQIGTEYYSIKVGQKHKIKRGVLNSFLLGNYENNRTIRVRRQQ